MKMNKYHKLELSSKSYPRDLRFIERQERSYALAVEVDEIGNIQNHTKVKINDGDTSAAHGYLHQ